MPSYQKLCAEFYDLDEPTAPPDARAYYRAYAQRSGGRILEPIDQPYGNGTPGAGAFVYECRKR
jgi:hypothetical protein